MKERVVEGTQKKLKLRIDPIGGHTLSSYDFTVEYFTSAMRVVKLTKEECLKRDDNTYIIRVDTALTGTGELKVNVVLFIPDSDFIEGVRKEVLDLETDYVIIARLR